MSKAEKIKAEIERRKKTWNHQDPQYVAGGKDVCDYLLGFIDSLEEGPVSNDLEKAAVEAFKRIVDSDKNSFYEIFKAGAQWQKEKIIDKAIKWLEDNIDRYLYNTGGYGEYIPKCGGKMFEDFKKAMEK